MKKTTLTTFEVAKYCQVTDRTVLGWIESGKLTAYRTPGRHNRVKVVDFVEFLVQYNMPIPVEFDVLVNRAKRILVVDDHVELTDAIKRFLVKEGYSVETAFNGFMAGTVFATFKPDIVVLDIMMPHMNGFDVCELIREGDHNDHVKIIAMSANTDERGIKRIHDLGADDFLAKPFKREELLERITRVMAWLK